MSDIQNTLLRLVSHQLIQSEPKKTNNNIIGILYDIITILWLNAHAIVVLNKKA